MAKGLSLNNVCMPVIISATLSILSLIGIAFNAKAENKVQSALTTIVVGLFWVYVLYELCRTSHEGWAWFILLLPVILTVALLVLVAIIALAGEPRQVNPSK